MEIDNDIQTAIGQLGNYRIDVANRLFRAGLIATVFNVHCNSKNIDVPCLR